MLLLHALLLLAASCAARKPIRLPDIHDWLDQNSYICDLDPLLGRVRFLSASEARAFRCRCGEPSRTQLACARKTGQRPFCAKIPEFCIDEYLIQFAGPDASLESARSALPPSPPSPAKPNRPPAPLSHISPFRAAVVAPIDHGAAMAPRTRITVSATPTPIESTAPRATRASTLSPPPPLRRSTISSATVTADMLVSLPAVGVHTVLFETAPSLAQLAADAALTKEERVAREEVLKTAFTAETRPDRFVGELTQSRANRRTLSAFTTTVAAASSHPTIGEFATRAFDINGISTTTAASATFPTLIATTATFPTLITNRIDDDDGGPVTTMPTTRDTVSDESARAAAGAMAALLHGLVKQPMDDAIITVAPIIVGQSKAVVDEMSTALATTTETTVALKNGGLSSSVEESPSTRTTSPGRSIIQNRTSSPATSTETPNRFTSDGAVALSTVLQIVGAEPATIAALLVPNSNVTVASNVISVTATDAIANEAVAFDETTTTEEAKWSYPTVSTSSTVFSSTTTVPPTTTVTQTVASTKTTKPQTMTPRARVPSTTSIIDLLDPKPSQKPFNPRVCEDNHNYCDVWKEVGECEKNPGFMFKFCRVSCGICALRRS